ncbi:MAG: hypothetical protein ABIG69_06590 [Bacteroidota bacterium]
MKKNINKLFFLIFILSTPYVQGQSFSVEQKIESLLSKMTAEEKIGQLVQTVGIKENTSENIKSGKFGSISWIKSAEEVGKLYKNKTSDVKVSFNTQNIHLFINEEAV